MTTTGAQKRYTRSASGRLANIHLSMLGQFVGTPGFCHFLKLVEEFDDRRFKIWLRGVERRENSVDLNASDTEVAVYPFGDAGFSAVDQHESPIVEVYRNQDGKAMRIDPRPGHFNRSAVGQCLLDFD